MVRSRNAPVADCLRTSAAPQYESVVQAERPTGPHQRGSCGTLASDKKCKAEVTHDPETTALTSDCADGDGDDATCATSGACEAACAARNEDGCCYWKSNDLICEFYHGEGTRSADSAAHACCVRRRR